MNFASENATTEEGRGRRSRARWTPIELAAMVGGFAVFWPIGLAILMLKLWQKQEGYPGDMISFARSRVPLPMRAQWERAAKSGAPWRSFATASTGNAAFDDWRAKELARLEEERRKLADAEHEFAQHLEKLRRARDREEFEQFMRERHAQRSEGVDI